MVLAETLVNVADVSLPHQSTPGSSEGVFDFRRFRRGKNPIQDRMVQSGWCNSTAQMLHDMLDNIGLYIASRLRPLFRGTEEISHSVHIAPVFRRLDRRKHLRYQAHGRVSRVRARLRGRSQEIVTSQPYVAISHVWAQGLGNAQANSLPCCQLLRLKNLINDLPQLDNIIITRSPEQFCVWIDTLCVPIEPHLKDVRQMAITRMASAFHDADHVLVLDTDLISASCNSSRLENTVRLLACPWMRRLWTYQEAVVSKTGSHCPKLQLQFSDGPIRFHWLLNPARSLLNTEIAAGVQRDNLPLVGNTSDKFLTLTRALKYRSTSKIEDEAICLAAILGHDVTEITRAKEPQQKMKIFYSFLDCVPAEIIFCDMQRMNIDGYRWAPVSFLQQPIDLYTGLEASRDIHGLYVSFSAFRFLRVSPPPKSGDHFRLIKELGGQGKSTILSPLIGTFGLPIDLARLFVRSSRTTTQIPHNPEAIFWLKRSQLVVDGSALQGVELFGR
ncbi:hypothetical protein K440DRAFT_636836 [Wilcoxina mikolae CBS 423.85]|nr:hypothetical protein K440DRAFT_636836 [Wilcoxina mikolae CBS 423.85]